MSKRRPRLKWTLFSLTMFLIVLWGTSLVIYAGHLSGRWRVRMDYGVIFASCYFGPEYQIKDIVFRGYRLGPTTHGGPAAHWGFQSQFPYRATLKTWYPRYSTPSQRNIPGVWSLEMQMPFWLLVLLTGIPTAYLFWKDRRKKGPGFCGQCGYDLKGNVSGKCPECGKEVRTSTALPANS